MAPMPLKFFRMVWGEERGAIAMEIFVIGLWFLIN